MKGRVHTVMNAQGPWGNDRGGGCGHSSTQKRHKGRVMVRATGDLVSVFLHFVCLKAATQG